MSQAHTLDELLGGAPLIVTMLSVASDAIVNRLSNRRICEACGITQSVFVGSEGENEACPYCGGRLVRRQDDAPETIRRRLENYAAVAEPLIAYYRDRPSFAIIDGLQRPDDVTAAIAAHVTRQRILLADRLRATGESRSKARELLRSIVQLRVEVRLENQHRRTLSPELHSRTPRNRAPASFERRTRRGFARDSRLRLPSSTSGR